MKKLLTFIFILLNLSLIGQVKTKVEYGLKSIFTPTINAYEYKLNGVVKEFSQWTTTGSYIYFMNNVGIGVNNPTYRLHVVGNALFDIGGNGQFVISSSSQARELFRINNVDVYKTFEIDGANVGYKVGIGTSSPNNKLDVVGTIGSTDLRISTGKIGVGTASPSTSLHILGSTPKIRLEESTNGYWWTMTSFTGVGSDYGGFKIGTSLKDNCLTIQNETGNIGINKEEASYTLDVAGTTRFGTSSNYTSTESDGTLVFTGNATVFDDVQANLIVGGANTPSVSVYNGSTLRAYEFNGNAGTKDINAMIQLPHSYKEGSNINMHLHLYIPNDVTGGIVKYYCAYTWTNINSTGAISETTISGTITRTAGQGIANNAILDFGTITGIGKTISSILAVRVYRDAADIGDTFASSTWLKSLDAHFEKDTDGSRTISSK